MLICELQFWKRRIVADDEALTIIALRHLRKVVCDALCRLGRKH